MPSKSILAAAVLAGASAATAFEHPTFHGHGGYGGHHPCKTTSTVIVYATETATVYEGAEGWGSGSGSGSTAAGGASAGGYPTYGGGAPAGPATVTVTATVSIDAAGQGYTWGVGDGNGASTAGAGSNSVANGWGSGNGNGASTAGAASTGVANGWGSGNGNGASTAGAASTSVANGWGSGNGNGASGGAGGSSTTTAGSGNGGKGGYGTGSATGSVTGSATGSGPTGTGSALCLTNATASYLTNGYGQLLSAYTNATANSLLAADFTDTSDSINWLAGIPLGGYTFSSKAAFIAGQGTQPPIGFTVNSIMFSCTEVAFRWTATVGLQKFPAKGINLFTASNLNNTEAGWQIETMYSEFDVGAWEVDIGRTCSPQGANIAGST